MNSNIKVLMPFEIPRLDQEVDTNSIKSELDNYVKNLVINVNMQDMADWKILINVIAQRTDSIAVSKRVARFPTDKENVIYTAIPIPDEEQVEYGLTIVKDAFFKASNAKYSHILDPNFENYTSLYEYILESSKRAIELAFIKGFTCNGKKIILKKQA